VDTRTKHFILLSVVTLLLSFVWVLSVVLAVLKVHSHADGAVHWMGCSVAPLGVWLRWYLARLIGQGIGKQRSLRWLPIGTLAANVLAAGIMAALAVTSKAVRPNCFPSIFHYFSFSIKHPVRLIFFYFS
jgi:fluoride exporter